MISSSWLFYAVMIMSTMISMSASNWMSMWMGLEMNLLSFSSLILNKKSKSSSEAAMIYFMIQSLSSILLLMSVTVTFYSSLIPKEYVNTIMTISLLMKLGAAPFHLWLPEVLSKMEWKKCYLMMTWQKMAPLMIMSNIEQVAIMNLMIIWSIGVGSIGGINQSSLRKMLGYSSINHLGWMLMINKLVNSWITYLLIYSILLMNICMLFKYYNLYFINQISSINLTNLEKISYMIMMLSLGGLPPFLEFLPKWIVIQNMSNNKEFLMMIVMIMFSMITLFYYMRVMTFMALSSSITIKWKYMKSNSFNLIFSMMTNLSLPLILMLDMI